ncbi:MAG: methylamine utilization protein [Gammaproteobacteria bacterium]|nr:methylamine utilization protein [Gammaproteobacteria bacterium]
MNPAPGLAAWHTALFTIAWLVVPGVGVADAASLVVQTRDAQDRPMSDAVVYLVAEQPGPVVTPAAEGMIDQIDRDFTPPVSAVQVGATVHFPNSDNIRHHVYSFSTPKIFEIRLYSGTAAEPIVFDAPGLVVLGCNIHDHMIAWLYINPSEHFGLSDAQGQITLSGLPEGEYRVYAWHRDWPGSAQLDAVTLAAGEQRELALRLDQGYPQSAATLDIGALR